MQTSGRDVPTFAWAHMGACVCTRVCMSVHMHACVWERDVLAFEMYTCNWSRARVLHLMLIAWPLWVYKLSAWPCITSLNPPLLPPGQQHHWPCCSEHHQRSVAPPRPSGSRPWSWGPACWSLRTSSGCGAWGRAASGKAWRRGRVGRWIILSLSDRCVPCFVNSAYTQSPGPHHSLQRVRVPHSVFMSSPRSWHPPLLCRHASTWACAQCLLSCSSGPPGTSEHPWWPAWRAWWNRRRCSKLPRWSNGKQAGQRQGARSVDARNRCAHRPGDGHFLREGQGLGSIVVAHCLHSSGQVGASLLWSRPQRNGAGSESWGCSTISSANQAHGQPA